ncbi:class I SAM-dependent methyltransferase [Antrihabitans cavernicola]|uniref:Class I SAM-dependent methyltransferase n=1 Tax=Antrihabitans cavernicola TaxID=2495913 RepID=A0A5A7S8P4_9NOCA|nr:class I SAM-dependent methyltransferase [Spelaeibacter cavernicola]KAA0018909.1 class I SAM-dependent methyltransferase [Spelaeibacter cavernicola]
MVTLPREEPHRARGIAESFGIDPQRYDRARPRYPDVMVRQIVAESPGRTMLDVGCGTGIAARQFRSAGCDVLGVDVDPRMAEFARRGGFDVEVSTFEDWDAKGRTFDAVVAGQTWHWVEPVRGAAKAAKVLRPNGRLALFWNAAEPPADLSREFADVYRRVAPNSIASRGSAMRAVDGYSALADKAADGVRSDSRFGEPQRWLFDWEHRFSRDEWLDQVPTTADHAQFPSAQLTKLLDGIGAVIDAAGGSLW